MKTIYKAALAICILLSLAGCGPKEQDSVTPPGISASEQAAQSLPAPTSKEPEAPEDTAPSFSTSGEEDVLVIGEKMFLTQIDDIYINFENYKDKTVVVEGMYTLFFNQDGVRDTPAVYRRGPGCCGNDGWGGFLLKYDGEFPADNDWIRVTGTPELVENDYFQDLYLNVTNIEILEERGAEFVTQ